MPVQPVQGGGGSGEEDPFAPIGIRSGSFLLFPTLMQTLGYTDNADFEVDGEESAFSLTSARLRLTSDWFMHQLTAENGGSYQTFFNATSDDLPVFDGNAELRFDHTRDFTTTWGNPFLRTTESPSSRNLSTVGPAFVVGRTAVTRGTAFGQAEKQWGVSAPDCAARSPERFTTVTATAEIAFSPSTNIGESGSITYAETVGVSRDVSASLTLNARVLASLQDYEGSSRRDETLQATLGSEWRLNCNMAIIGELGYETVDRTDIDRPMKH